MQETCPVQVSLTRQAYKKRMSSAAALPPEVAQALARGWTILTANQRAARTLRRAFDTRQRAGGATVWQPAAVFAFSTWLERLYRNLLASGGTQSVLLTATQQHALWIEVLRTDPEQTAGRSLQQLDALAELCARAYSLAHAYGIRARIASAAETSDTRAFARWANAFDNRIARAGLLAAASLPQHLTQAIATGSLEIHEAGILLVGFDQRSPAEDRLLEALRRHSHRGAECRGAALRASAHHILG
jgi:hypothetical protein